MKVVLGLCLIFAISVEAKRLCKIDSAICPKNFKHHEIIVAHGSCPSVDEVKQDLSEKYSLFEPMKKGRKGKGKGSKESKESKESHILS